MSCSCSSACPEVVPTVNRTEVTMPGFPDVEIEHYRLTESAPHTYGVRLAVVDDSLDRPWLIRVWFTDALSSEGYAASQETLTPPAVPGISQFFIVTSADGTYNFSVSDPSLRNWYVNAAVVGRAAASSVMEFTT